MAKTNVLLKPLTIGSSIIGEPDDDFCDCEGRCPKCGKKRRRGFNLRYKWQNRIC